MDESESHEIRHELAFVPAEICEGVWAALARAYPEVWKNYRNPGEISNLENF